MTPKEPDEPDETERRPRRRGRLYAPVQLEQEPAPGPQAPAGLRGALEAAFAEVTRVETAATILLVSTSGDEAASDQLDDLVASARRLRGALKRALEATT